MAVLFRFVYGSVGDIYFHAPFLGIPYFQVIGHVIKHHMRQIHPYGPHRHIFKLFRHRLILHSGLVGDP